MILIEGNREALYQWDLNQRIILKNIAVGTQVHFANSNIFEDCCPIVISYNEGENTFANIPNYLLQTNGILYAYAYVQEDEKSYTKHNFEIIVLPRKRPAEYIYTETEIYTFKSVVNKALAEAKANGEFDGKDGVNGKDGNPGIDGYTPQKGVDYWTEEDKEEILSDEVFLSKIEYWKPNTRYKVGQQVFAPIKTLAPSEFLGIMKCITEHTSGTTFPQTSDLAYREYVNDCWEMIVEVKALNAAFATQASVASEALSDIEGNFIPTTYATKAALTEIEMIAKGRATGYVFDTKADMDAWLANSENVAKLVLGDNLYIRAKDVPDYWWDGSLAQELETQKVDLTEYATKSELTAAIGEALEGDY